MAFIGEMRSRIFSIINNVFLFKYTYIILAFISFIPVTRIYFGFLTKIILIWGAYLIFYRFLLKRDIKRKSGVVFLFLLVFSYCVSILLNYKYGFAHNILNACYLSVNLLVVYGLDKRIEPKILICEIRKINFLIIGLSGIASFISIVMFILMVKFKLLVDGLHINQGFEYNRLYGVYVSLNAAAMLAVVSVAVTIINILLDKKLGKNKRMHILYVSNIVIQFLYIILSDSRGAVVSAICLFIITIFLWAKERYLTNSKQLLKFSGVILIAVAIVVLGVFALKPARIALSYIPVRISYNSPSMQQRMLLPDSSLIPRNDLAELFTKGPYDTIVVPDTITDSVPDIKPGSIIAEPKLEVGRNSYNATGLRWTIWVAHVKLWENYPIFGVADSKVSDNPQKFDSLTNLSVLDHSEILRVDGNSHNGYLQVLVTGGIVAFLLFATFIGSFVLKTAYNILWNNLSKKYFTVIILTFATVLSLLFNALFESHIVFRYADFIGVITWIFAGYSAAFINSFHKSADRKENE